MNLAFLVEGVTELKLYPKWINHFSMTPLTECTTGYSDVIDNQFTIFNVNGIGKMVTGIPAAINAIIANPVFTYLVIIVDADDNNITNSLAFIQNIIASAPSLPPNCQIKIIVQQVCIETWFVGHTDYYLAAKSCKNKGIQDFMLQYDVENNDPELMHNLLSTKIHSISAYHATFLYFMLKGADKSWKYKKSTVDILIDIPYLQRLEQRLIETPTHLQSFSNMISFLKSI